MKKISILLVIFFTLAASGVFSQDIIFKADGTKEEAKVLMVNDNEIQFKKFDNQEGPVYTIDISKVVLITYENGDYDMFQPQPGENKHVEKSNLSGEFEPNILNYHVFDVFYGDITFSYERILAKGIMGLHFPVSFGYAYNMDFYDNNNEWVKNLFYSGVGLNFYPGGQGKVRYFVGPEFLFGFGKQSYWTYYYDEYGNYIDDELTNEGFYMKYMVNNGIRFTPIKNFSFAAILGVGVRFFPEADYSNEVVRPTGHFGIDVSYRF
jgi:hypothetical protein